MAGFSNAVNVGQRFNQLGLGGQMLGDPSAPNAGAATSAAATGAPLTVPQTVQADQVRAGFVMRGQTGSAAPQASCASDPSGFEAALENSPAFKKIKNTLQNVERVVETHGQSLGRLSDDTASILGKLDAIAAAVAAKAPSLGGSSGGGHGMGAATTSNVC